MTKIYLKKYGYLSQNLDQLDQLFRFLGPAHQMFLEVRAVFQKEIDEIKAAQMGMMYA